MWGQVTMIHAWMVRTPSVPFVYRNVPSRLNYIHERRVEILRISIESPFVTLGSGFAGVRHFPLHSAVHYRYLMLCPRVFGISQTDYHFLCRLLVEYSNLKDFQQWPSVPHWSLLEWNSTVSFMTDCKDTGCDHYTSSSFLCIRTASNSP